MKCQLSLEKKINAIAILENFLSSSESTICKKMDFGASDLDFQAPKIKVLYHFFENFD